jgi:NAD(P)-dependent dehydrogenase (short-subunit alcohol dehydrogenase family)
MGPLLDGKAALVTGAAGGIGGAAARAFANARTRVFCVDRVDHDDIDFIGDLCRADDAERAVATAEERLGRLDIVFNGAGISGRGLGDGPVDVCTEEAWNAVLDANLKSVFLCSKYAIPALRRSGGGAIVNLSSSAGGSSLRTHGLYAATKATTDVLTRALALELRERNITVNAVSLEVHRPCAPNQVADVIAYLLSEHGHGLTGQVLRVGDPG